MFGRCKVCQEKDLRIVELQAQVDLLRALVAPPASASRIPILQAESDAILSGRDEAITPTAEQQRELERIESEANRIFSGTY